MKYIFFLFMGILISPSLWAQKSSTLQNAKYKKLEKIIKKFEPATTANENKKLRVIDDRLIAEVYEEGVDIDSTTYTYSGTRGSQLMSPFYLGFVEDIDYDLRTNYYPMNTANYKSAKTFSNNLLNTNIDSFYNGIWEPAYRRTYTYDASNNKTLEMVEMWNGASWENEAKTVFVYNAGLLMSQIYISWNGFGWDSMYRTNYTYNGTNKTLEHMEMYLSGVWTNLYQTISTYNANNQIVGEIYQIWNGMWENEDKYAYYYNASNKMDSVIYQIWDGAQWNNEERYRSIWTNNRITILYTEIWNGSIWENYNRFSISYNNKEYPISQISETWNGNAYVYDVSADYKARFYYQEYNNGVAVNDVEDISTKIKVFPNPANDILTIQKIDQEIEIENIKIVNIKGEVLSHIKLNHSNALIQLSVKELPTGLYLLNMNARNKNYESIQFIKK